MNWQTIATVALTAITTILAATGTLSADEQTQIATTGAAAITGVGSFAAAILAAVKARKERGQTEG